jgi:hypothetical protein
MREHEMKGRRQFLLAIATVAIGFQAGMALASPPTVEIIAMPHPPVMMALQPLRDWLASQGGKLHVKEIDSESPEGMKRLQVAGLSGHVPVLILIDGQHSFKRKDGSQVAFVNFPNAPDTPSGARGNWVTSDVQAILAERLKGK